MRVQLDEVFHQPVLMAVVIFSFHRILLGSSASNSRLLAIDLLELANPSTPSAEIGDGLIKLVAVIVITMVCLLQYFARPLCFVFNSSFASFKVMLLLVMFISGFAVYHGKYAGLQNFTEKHTGFDGVESMTAMIYVIFSYQGFINVNCVSLFT